MFKNIFTFLRKNNIVEVDTFWLAAYDLAVIAQTYIFWNFSLIKQTSV